MKSFLSHDKLQSYSYGLEIKITKERGRGLFAKKDLKRGDLLIVEQAIAEGCQRTDD